MLTYIVAWVATALAFLGLDVIWLSQMGPRFYKDVIGDQMRPNMDVAAAGAFYLIYVTAIVYFAVAPALAETRLTKALLNGAFLGFVAYATYNLSNQATLRFWDVRLTLLDMAWGTFVTAVAAGIAYAVASRFG